jgi:16S rRNA (uracil1498-N3)-methyltransferase
MRLHRFYIENSIEAKTVKIDDKELIHQWKNVFRYTVGGQVIVFNGDGYDYLCMITEIYGGSAVLELISRKKAFLPTKNIGLVMSLIKKDNMELVIQKATELGVSHIFPVIAERSEKKSLNMERAVKIAVEASEQSGRGDVPKIYEPVSLKELLSGETLDEFDQKIIFHLKEDKFVPEVINSDSVAIAIGPEGGFSDSEVDLFSQANFKKYSIGDLTLRAETAVMAGLSLISLC